MANSLFERYFPKLVDALSKKTSDATQQYNCIAWAFEDNTKWWWPMPRRYWPISYSGMTAMESFERLFSVKGWTQTNDRGLEVGYKKIALYFDLKAGRPTHAARQLPTGMWTSKLGGEIDLSHELRELEGPTYGVVFKIYKKPT